MIYITGDTHRDFKRIAEYCGKIGTNKGDTLIILGDAGINYYGGEKDRELKQFLAELPITLFCIHGNHEQRPETLGYGESERFGGMVYKEPEFPFILFAKDGEIYEIADKRCIVIGGAYSVDKRYRLMRGWGWWSDEQPSEEIKRCVIQRLDSVDWKIDYVLSHTCPLKYEPTEMFLENIDPASVDKSTEQWLDTIEDKLEYLGWMCGHWHTDKRVGRVHFIYKQCYAIYPFK